MFTGYLVVAAILAFALLLSGRGKLVKDERIVASLTGAGVPLGWYPYLAAAELAGALGLLAGMVFAPLGIAAAAAILSYFVGAVIAHLRVGDFKGLTPAVSLLVLAVAALFLRIASA